MAITSLFIDAKLPAVAGMRKLSDFAVNNFFENFPRLLTANPYAGFFFGDGVTDLAYNSFDPDVSGRIVGTLNNSEGYVSVGVDNYLDTNLKAPVDLTVAGLFRRPATPPASLFFVTDFILTGGFAVGFGSSGGLRAVLQNIPTSLGSVDIAFPASVEVGSYCAFTAQFNQSGVVISVYDPATNDSKSMSTTAPGERKANSRNVLVGRKYEDNATALNTDVVSIVLLEGALSPTEHLTVQKYLYDMI